MNDSIQPTRNLEADSGITSAPNVNLNRAWALRALWGPVAQTVESVIDASSAKSASGPFRILAIGRHPEMLQSMLAQSRSQKLPIEVHALKLMEDVSVPFEKGSFDCAVAVDWLPFLRSSQRQQAVAELCRIARGGIVLVNPFHSPEIADAERRINTLYVSASGKDHRELGRHIEAGLPDLETVRGWLGNAFPHLTVEPLESLNSWQMLASLDALEPSDHEITGTEMAVAAILPQVNQQSHAASYRTVVVGSNWPVPASTSQASPREDFASVAIHLAIEASAQRRALDRLIEAVTSGRDQERVEFRETVASLAAELHESEARLEVLEESVRERDRIILNQTATINGLEERLKESDSHVLNLESERDATKVHVQNLESQRTATANHIKNLDSERRATRDHVKNLENERQATNAHIRNLEDECATIRTHVRNLENEREVTATHMGTLKEECDAANERARDLESERFVMQTRLRKLETDHEALNFQVRNLEKEREDTRVHVRNLESERDAWKAKSLSVEDTQSNGATNSFGRVRRKLLKKE
jgi:predicted  nucleic acid-binding Zn-ribbon protein